jgi:hypothetical protein
MSGAPIMVHFDTGSPFDSAVTDLPIHPPRAMTEWQTVKLDVPTGTGDNPDYKYTVTVLGVPPDDPDLVIDLSTGGPGAGGKAGGGAKGGSGGGTKKPSPKHKPKTKPKPIPKHPVKKKK